MKVYGGSYAHDAGELPAKGGIWLKKMDWAKSDWWCEV
jgi:hypothetical protein